MDLDFDAESVVNSFMQGRSLRMANEQLKARREDEKLRRELLQHQIRQSKLNEKVQEFEKRKGMVGMLEGLEPKATELAGPPQEGEPGLDRPAEPGIDAPIPGRHPSISFAGLEEIGIPPIDVQPRSLSEVRKQGLADLLAKRRVETEIPLDPRVRRLLPADMQGMESMPKEVFEKLVPQAAAPKAPEQEVEISPGVAPEIVGPGGGKFGASELDLMKEQFSQRQQTERSRFTAQEATRRGAITGAAGIDPATDESVKSFVNMLATGQMSFASVPLKYKPAVAQAMGLTNRSVLSKAAMDKMDHFASARGAVDKLRSTLDRVEQAGDPVSKMTALWQFDAERDALSRTVGRALGEKGVFTDQDKEGFKRILGFGMAATAWDPTLTRDRLDELEKLMESVKQREFEAVRERTGAGSVGAETTGTAGTAAAIKAGKTKGGATWEVVP